MPCSDGGPTKSQLLKEGKEKVDRLTRYLCGVLHYKYKVDEDKHGVLSFRDIAFLIPDIEDSTPGIEPGELEGWFHAHCKQDKEREKLNFPSVGF